MKIRLFLLTFLAWSAVFVPACAQPSLDMKNFSTIPILNEGRVKPLDSFARITLKQIYGEAALPQASATAWLARILFTPSAAMDDPIFRIRSHDVIQLLSLPERRDGLYSFSELARVFAAHESYIAALRIKDRKSLLPLEQEVANLYMKVDNFAEIMGTFSLLLPFPAYAAPQHSALGSSPATPVTYLDLLGLKGRGEDLTVETDEAIKSMDELEQRDKTNALVRLIPPFWNGETEWRAPWAVIEEGRGSPQSAVLFEDWQKVALAYRLNDTKQWDEATRKVLADDLVAAPLLKKEKLVLEVAFQTIDPLSKSLALYILGLAFILIRYVRPSSFLTRVTYGVLVLGVFLHGIGLLMRMIILMRPPVSTLYESMIYVSFVAMLFGLLLERKAKNEDGLLISSSIAALLLLTSRVFAGSADTMGVLIAVLNTNFWLATHVVCITTGYGSALVGGMLGHVYIWRRALQKDPGLYLKKLSARIHKVALIALLFSAVGTMLGGIWADQSWGRFWGWDPKENGALWIVLWLIWLLHGRIAGQLRETSFAAGMALTNIVVALAWVGVNLLSVGLHSYGFTDIASNGLLIFCGSEIILIAFPLIVIRYKTKLIHAH